MVIFTKILKCFPKRRVFFCPVFPPTRSRGEMPGRGVSSAQAASSRRPPRQGESPVRVGGSDVVVDHAGAMAFGSHDLGFSRPALGGDGHPPFRRRYEQNWSQPPKTFALGRWGGHVPALHGGSNAAGTPFWDPRAYILFSGFRFLEESSKSFWQLLTMFTSWALSLEKRCGKNGHGYLAVS